MKWNTLVLSIAVGLAACSSLPVKEQSVKGLEASNTALHAAFTVERNLCFNAPATESGGHCSNGSAVLVGLTDARHQEVSKYFSAAFDAEIKAATVLKAWKAGDPYPSDLASYQADANAVLGVAKALAPGSADLLSKAQQAVDDAVVVAKALGVK